MADEHPTGHDQPNDPSVTASPAGGFSSEMVRPARGLVDFPPTRWTLVLEASEGEEGKAQQAIAELCEHYRSAIQGYFRMKCRDPHAAEDLAGAFVLHLLE